IVREIVDLSAELAVRLRQANATGVGMGDLRENSGYKAALARQQIRQARLWQPHQRLNQLAQLASTEAPTDQAGLDSKAAVRNAATGDIEEYTLVLAEMMDIDAGHISLASPLGRALKDRQVGDEVTLQLPTMRRTLVVTDLVTVHQLIADD